MYVKIQNIRHRYHTYLCTDFDTVCSGTQFDLNNQYLLYIQVGNVVEILYILANTSTTDSHSMKCIMRFHRKVRDRMGQPDFVEALVPLDKTVSNKLPKVLK